MNPFNLIQLPNELLYLIFRYMRKSDVIYAFYELDERFATAVQFFVSDSLNLADVSPPVNIYILSKLGSQIRRLAIGGRSFNFSIARDCLIKYCANVERLDIFCTTTCHDVRDYLQFVHWDLKSFSIIDKQRQLYPNIATNLYLQSQIQVAFVYRRLTLHVTDYEANNIALLDWHQRSVEMTEGLYEIENIFGHKFIIPQLQNSRAYVGDIGPLKNRIFRLEHVRYREYRLRHYQSNTILCIYHESLNNEAPLVLNTNTDQTLTFESVGDNNSEYYIWPTHQRSTNRRKVLDVYNDPYGRAGQNGAQVQLYSFHGGLNQRFHLRAVDENSLVSTDQVTKKTKYSNWLQGLLKSTTRKFD
ncbi:hypothetical protein I4U23_031350 [Adineta vaga]|nr:hypothetical protein I4U23_031350 [Adineta vaga]